MPAIPQKLRHFILLTRLHKPVGTILLLWPALWGLWLAAGGVPDMPLLAIFVVGAFVMRAAGCAINDFADRHIDGGVERTSYRPLATGDIRPWEAIAVFVALSLAGLWLVLQTNPLTVALACIGVAIIAAYPFMKRYTHWPQLVLGIAWGWSIPMAFAAQTETLPWQLWPLVFAVIAWTIVFDTFYAMVDRDDDLKIGVKSTAILFGRHDLTIIGLLQLITVLLLVITGQLFHRGLWFYAGIFVVALLFGYQLLSCLGRERSACFAAFMHNRWVGVVVFVALVADYGLG
ncbi:MAG: 4-hydroxybenzoate octaprenyltransferase [Porticoccaceae bacterium]|nr:4-hydroxybenzoate octaprenyltransferase [Porticoccaceae bacterium]